MTAFALGEFANGDVVRTLFERHRIRVRSIDYGLNAVRASTHYYNSNSEVERLLEGVWDIAQRGVVR